MPTAACTSSYSAASFTQAALVSAEMPIAMIFSTPAFRARATTSARSSSNSGWSKWACVSKSCMTTLLDRYLRFLENGLGVDGFGPHELDTGKAKWQRGEDANDA